jgi:D-alanyl-D-alanine dipeptidase
VTKSLNTPEYSGLLRDPDALHVPVNFASRPLPLFVEPDELPYTAVPALRDNEAMVELQHRNIWVLQAYYHAGWQEARPGTFVREGVAARLVRVAESLPDGFGLAVLDAWRPLALQAALFEAVHTDLALPAGFVSAPSADPATPPPHLTGGCVDVTLTWNQQPLALGSSFDAFTDEARAGAYEDTPGRVRELRRLLYWSMREEGFVVIDTEWWHFEIGTRRWAALLDEAPWYGAADIVLAEPARFTSSYRIVNPS